MEIVYYPVLRTIALSCTHHLQLYPTKVIFWKFSFFDIDKRTEIVEVKLLQFFVDLIQCELEFLYQHLIVYK